MSTDGLKRALPRVPVEPVWQVCWPFAGSRPVWSAGEMLLTDGQAYRLTAATDCGGPALWYTVFDAVRLRDAAGRAWELGPGQWMLGPALGEASIEVGQGPAFLGYMSSPGLRETVATRVGATRPIPAAARDLAIRLHQGVSCPLPGRFGCWRLTVQLLETLVEGGVAPPVPESAPCDDPAVAKALCLLDAAEDEYPTVRELAAQVGLSQSQFARRFVARMGRSFRDYLSQHRLERARRLLEDGAGNVTEAAFSAGYSSVSQFSRAFRRHFGKPPSAVARRPAREV